LVNKYSFNSFMLAGPKIPFLIQASNLDSLEKYKNRPSGLRLLLGLKFVQSVYMNDQFWPGKFVKMLVTPKQVAQAIGVSESSLKRWCDRGLLTTVRTAGGHRRLAIDDVFQFLRQSGQQLLRPELLGLPSNTGQGTTVIDRARDQIRDALVAGDEEQCRRIVFDLYLARQSACDICDRVLAPALHDIGESWECGELTMYRERRACELGLKMLHALSMAMRTPTAEAPQQSAALWNVTRIDCRLR
jgi:excisionase family DNA binding protein